MWATISTSCAAVAVNRYFATASESRRLDEDAIAADLDRADARQPRQRPLVCPGQAGPDRSACRQVADLGGGAIGDDPALAEQDDPVGVGVRLFEVVGREQDRPAALGVAPNGGPEVAATLHIHPGRGLVEGHQGGIGHEGHGEPKPLLLATGAFPDQAVREMDDAGSLEHLVDRSRLSVDRGGQANGLADREVLEQAARLQDGGHETARDRLGGRHPEDAHGPLVGLSEAQDHVDGGRLACAVRAEQRGDLTDLEVQVDAIHCPHRAEAPMHVAEVDGGCRSVLVSHVGSLRPVAAGRP